MKLEAVTVKSIGEIKRFDNSEFYLTEVVVTTSDQYPQVLKIQFNKDKADNFIKYNKVGDVVDIDINLRGREWTSPEGKVSVFNTIEGWKSFKSNSEANTQPEAQPVEAGEPDLPF